MSKMREIKNLNGSNCTIWKRKLGDLLYVKDLVNLEDGGGRLLGMEEKIWKTLDKKCLGIIHKYVDDSIFHHV